MEHTPDEITQKLAARWCWEVACRDDCRRARRLYRTHLVDGVYRRDEGALLDAFVHFRHALGGMTLLEAAPGGALPRAMVPCVPSVWRSGRKTLVGMQRITARPRVLVRDEALRPLVGCHAPQVRHGLGQRGATKRQGERVPGPMCPETWATNLVPGNGRDREVVFNGARRAVATAGVLRAKVTGRGDGTALETTAPYTGCGQGTRQGRSAEPRGKGPALEVRGSGGTGLLRSAAVTKRPLAVTVGQIQAHAALWARALGTPARRPLAGDARLAKVVVAKGVVEGTTLWWLDQQGLRCGVPAHKAMAVPADARAPATAGADLTGGRRVDTGRPGQGQQAWSARRETEVVGMTGLTTDDQEGPPAPARHATRRDGHANPLHAVVGRTGPGTDDGPGGNPVCLTKAPGAQPVPPGDDEADRRRIDHCGLKEAKQPWELGPPPQQHARAGRGHVVCTLLRFAVATASRLPGEREACGGEPVGWQRGRRQRVEQHRDQVLVLAPGHYGLLHLAASSRLLGVKRNDVPPDSGRRQQVLAKDKLPTRAYLLCWNFSER